MMPMHKQYNPSRIVAVCVALLLGTAACNLLGDESPCSGALFSAAGFWVCDRLLMAWVHSFDPAATRGDLPIATLPLLMLVLTVFSLLLEPVQNIISRRYERQCDRYALERTGLKEAYVSAFRKLARINKSDPNPHALEVFLFHSHPPIDQRLAMAEEWFPLPPGED